MILSYDYTQHIIEFDKNELNKDVWLGAIDIHPTHSAIIIEYFVEISHKITCEVLDRQKLNKV